MKKLLTLLGCLLFLGCSPPERDKPVECERSVNIGEYFGSSVTWYYIPQEKKEEYRLEIDGKKIRLVDFEENGTSRERDGVIDAIYIDKVLQSQEICDKTISQLESLGILDIARERILRDEFDKIKLACKD
jgi:hypothetical protein